MGYWEREQQVRKCVWGRRWPPLTVHLAKYFYLGDLALNIRELSLSSS